MFTNSNKIFAVLLGCVAVRTSCEQDSNEAERSEKTISEKPQMPSNWPEQWNYGIIPFAYDYFSANPKSLMKIVHKGHDFIQQRACIRFQEQNPIAMAQLENVTYLYYSYSGVLEECCGTYFSRDTGRRLVLITPKCRAPADVAHATLHALGVTHGKNQRFPQPAVQAVLYPEDCVSKAFQVYHYGHYGALPYESSLEGDVAN